MILKEQHTRTCVFSDVCSNIWEKKKPRGLRLLLTGSCWWSGESSGVINSKQWITENSGCLTSDVWYNIWKAYISYCVFAFLIMFCFSQYGNELTGWEYKPINGWVSLLGSFLGVWNNGKNLKGFNAFYRQSARYVIHLGIMECWLQSTKNLGSDICSYLLILQVWECVYILLLKIMKGEYLTCLNFSKFNLTSESRQIRRN